MPQQQVKVCFCWCFNSINYRKHEAKIKIQQVILRVRVGYTVKLQQASSPKEAEAWEGFLKNMVLHSEGAISKHYAVFIAMCPRVCETHVSCMDESKAISLHFVLTSQKYNFAV